MRYLLLIDADKCSGCLECEKICSLKHEGETIPVRSMVKVIRRIMMGPDGYYVSFPVVCQQCETPMCKEVCPTNAIHEDSKTSAYLVDQSRCVGCRLCMVACPLGAIEVHPDKNIAYKCDLCDGDPLCAKVCLDGALTYVAEDKAGFTLRRETIKKLSERLEFIVSPRDLGDE